MPSSTINRGPEYRDCQRPAWELLRNHLGYEYADGESAESRRLGLSPAFPHCAFASHSSLSVRGACHSDGTSNADIKQTPLALSLGLGSPVSPRIAFATGIALITRPVSHPASPSARFWRDIGHCGEPM